MRKTDYEGMLNVIDPAQLDYNGWLTVGMAIQHVGLPVGLWDEWSRRDPERYHAGECQKKWDGFDPQKRGGVTGGTLYALAQQFGADFEDNNYALSWDSVISDERVVIDPAFLAPSEIKQPDAGYEGWKDIVKYIEALYQPQETVSVVLKSFKDEDGRYKPSGRGFHMTAGEIISRLHKHKDIGSALADYDPKAGGWVRFNPVNGKGVTDKDITAYRYALIESDEDNKEKQLSIIKSLELPTVAIVDSGNKSIHAIVRIDALDYREYRQRVNYLYSICEKNGLKLDKANKNPSRLSRLPGLKRDGQYQFLIDTHTGQPGFQEWQDFIEEINDDLGDPELPPADGKRPELAPELISGILRAGHKMLIAGPSKAGKSFLLLQLGIALARGREWLGRECKQGKVLYVNLELDRRSVWARVYDILEREQLSYKDLQGNFYIWNLRGKSVPMDKLAGKLIRRARDQNYSAVIIDPIYKVLTGDENNARDMALFANYFDRVATELETAVIYCHHHSKGFQGGKRSMDRASGSGVFARDPDALLDMVELDVDPAERMAYGFNQLTTAWRIEGTLREFAGFPPINCYFDYPTHRVDDKGLLKNLTPEEEKTPQQRGAEKAKKRAAKKREEDKKSFDHMFKELTSFTGSLGVTIKEMSDQFGITERALRSRIEDYKDYQISNGVIYGANLKL